MKLSRMVKLKEKSSNHELVISGRIFYEGRLTYGSIAIDDGKIVKIGRSLKGIENLDYGERIILPGFVDIHVHFREPGMEHKENFETGSKAGLRGGITTYFEMPNTRPPADRYSRIEEKIRIAKSKSYSDFGIYALVSEKTDGKAIESADACKIFMSASTESEEFGDYAKIGEALRAHYGKVIAIHAEHKDFVKKTNAKNLWEHYLSRKNAEVECVKFLCKYKDTTFHLCHISDPASLLEIKNATNISFEGTPHHALLSLKSGTDARYKVNPPLRSEEEREEIYSALVSGRIKILASDHAPHIPEEKEKFEDAPAGMPGIETMIPLFVHLAKHGKIPLEHVVNAGATNPAQLFSLHKGKIEEGYYADLTIWNPAEIREIRDKDVWSKCGWSAFSGFNAIFPEHVYLRGNLMIEDYEFVGRQIGKHVKELDEKEIESE